MFCSVLCREPAKQIEFLSLFRQKIRMIDDINVEIDDLVSSQTRVLELSFGAWREQKYNDVWPRV